jgi:TetR/AcrR family acrAB operon transcriptional repressor
MARKTKEEAGRTRQHIIDAARRTFHQCGVSRTSLEKVAAAAGVTRGAVYWHFADKAELFYAMHESSMAMIDRADSFLVSDDAADPLDVIETSILSFFAQISECDEVRETFEIMSLRCEYVDEFAPVLYEVNKPCADFLAKLEQAYQQALVLGTMRAGLDPQAMALDTLAFATGLINNWLAAQPGEALRENAPQMIRAHIALRRAGAK